MQTIDAVSGAQSAGSRLGARLSRVAAASPRRRLLTGGASAALHLAVLGAILAVPHRPPDDAGATPAQVAVVMVASLSPAQLPPENKPATPILSVPDEPPPDPRPAEPAAPDEPASPAVAPPTPQPQPPAEPMSAPTPSPQPAPVLVPPPPALPPEPPADEPVPVVLPVPPPPPEAPSPSRHRSEPVAHAPAARVPVRHDAVAANPAPASPAAPAASPQAVALTARTLSPSDLGAYRDRVAAHLRAYQHYPEMARMRREEGLVVVNVTIQRDGQIVAMSIEHGSGSPLLDEGALATLKRADPLPAMPADMPGATMALLFPLRFHLE